MKSLPLPFDHSPSAFMLMLCMLMFAVLFLNQAQAATVTLTPASYTTTSGAAGGQSAASALGIQDQSGTANSWNKYVEFGPASGKPYAGYQSFRLPADVAIDQITNLQVKVNYQGPSTTIQTWTWQIYDWTQNTYVTVGNNAGAPSWGAWKLLQFPVSGKLSNYVRAGDREIRLQLLANNTADATDIDYEAIVVTTGGTSTEPTPTPAPAITLTLAPAATSLAPKAALQLQLGGATAQAVSWSVNGVVGGNATVGTITTAGLYTAPATAPTPASVSVKATLLANATKIAVAGISITPSTTPTPMPILVSVAPSAASIAAGASQQLTASVQGSTAGVTWSVNGIVGGNASIGLVSANGLYMAPASLSSTTTVSLKATSQADASKTAIASITVVPTPAAITVSVAPSAANVELGKAQQLSATLQGATGGVVWSVNGINGGNATVGLISAAGLYQAPAILPNPASVVVRATAAADAAKFAIASIMLVAPQSASGKTFYVATSGVDTAAGSIDAPWRTIQRAVNSALPGDTISVRGGVYNEIVSMSRSGSASGGSIVLQSYPGELAVLDGTGLPVKGQQGMIQLNSVSYVTVRGFELRNFVSSANANVPVGIYIEGSGSTIQILNNRIHDIKTTGTTASANALGLAVYGTKAPASINNLVISGNEIYNLKTGSSESMVVNGNVQYWSVLNNVVHDNNNIGIDAIGFENTSPDPAYDQARDGLISGNTVYNITSYGNPAYGNQYAADGIYVDGGTRITIEGNLVHHVDIGIELASEHAGRSTSQILVRNNVVYASNTAGISIGGYEAKLGTTDQCLIVNNTLFNNDTKNSGSGEFQVQYNASNNVFKNNILFASAQGLFVNSFSTKTAAAVDINNNLYYSTATGTNNAWIWGGKQYNGLAAFVTGSGNDTLSRFADPQFLDRTAPNLRLYSSSPAISGGVNLGAAVNGTVDFAALPRVQGSNIDIGAFEQ